MLNSFLVTNADLDIVDVNAVFCEMTGYSRDELLKMNVRDFDALLTFDEIKMNLQTALQSGISHFETRNKRKDGSFLDVEVSLTKIEIKGQIYFASFGRDITPRKEAERKLKENEKQLSSAANIARLAYWEYEVASRLFTFNDQFYDLFRVTVEEIGGYQVTAMRYEELFIYPEDKDLVRNETVKAIKAADPNYNYRFEYRVIFPGPKVGYVAVHYFISKDANGKTIKVFGTIQDVSDRREAEEMLRKANERFEIASIATNDVIWDWDLISGNMWWNENFYRLFMLKKEEVKPDINSWYEGLHPDDLKKVKTSLLKTIENKAHYWSAEYRFYKSNKEIVYIFDRAYVLYDPSGNPYRMIGSMFNMTEQKKAAAALYALEQKMLYQKVQEQKQITRAIISAQEKERNRIGQELHDNVCQMLTGAKLYLVRTGKQDKKINLSLEYPIELIVSSIEELRSLSGENVTPLRDIGLKDLIQSLVRSLAQASSIKIDFICNIEDFDIDEDLKLNIYRIIQEQLTNIVKHAEAANVIISLEANTDTVNLVITDDGKGFDALKTRAGIGISNIFNRVESFNGKINIETFPGKGCIMKIEYPYKDLYPRG
jgi:PAS domain S-box-containing protein